MFGVKKLEKVKVFGVRTAHETKVFATYNSTVYCCMFMYSDGSRELKELSTKEMSKYVQYIAHV